MKNAQSACCWLGAEQQRQCHKRAGPHACITHVPAVGAASAWHRIESTTRSWCIGVRICRHVHEHCVHCMHGAADLSCPPPLPNPQTPSRSARAPAQIAPPPLPCLCAYVRGPQSAVTCPHHCLRHAHGEASIPPATPTGASATSLAPALSQTLRALRSTDSSGGAARSGPIERFESDGPSNGHTTSEQASWCLRLATRVS